MKYVLVVACVVFATLPAFADTRTFTANTNDGVTIYGEVMTPSDPDHDAPLILLFHQGGGDSRNEYAPVAPRLLAAGYNLVGIDQRLGGDRFGGENRTANGAGSVAYGYCDAMPDLEAALKYARTAGFNGPVAAWGSSYSATLAIWLAHKYPDEIDAVLAFSPASGDPMEGCRPDDVSVEVTAPVLALRPAGEMEIDSVRTQMDRFRAAGFETYVADPGVHGSSMLVEDRVGGSTEAHWSVVLRFLEETLQPEM